MTETHALNRARLTTRILIADRNLLFRRGLRTVLSRESDFTLLDDAGDGTEVLSKVQAENPDILVVSLDLLGTEPRRLGYLLRAVRAELSIMVLTASDSPENLQHSIEAGAQGYMLKDSAPAHFVRAIRQLATASDPAALSSTVPDLRALAERTPYSVRPHSLTGREQEVVRLLAEGKTVKEVAHELSLSIKTIEAHKLNLMRKLNIHNRSTLIDYAVREGMVTV